MTKKKNYLFETRMDVRDYECDIQGIAVSYTHLTLPTNREV